MTRRLIRQTPPCPVGFDGNLAGNFASTPFWDLVALFNGGASNQREPFLGTTEANVVGNAMTAGTVNDVVAARRNETFMASAELGGRFTWQAHVDRCLPDNGNADVVLVNAVGIGDDAKVWSAAKLANARWRCDEFFRTIGRHFAVATTENEPSGCVQRFCAVAGAPQDVGATVGQFKNCSKVDSTIAMSRVTALLKQLWNSSRVGNRRSHTAIIAPPLAEGSQKKTGAAQLGFTVYQLYAYNSGEILKYCDGVGAHYYDFSLRWNRGGEADGDQSPWHTWKAIQAGQALAGTGPAHFLWANEWGYDERRLPAAQRAAWNYNADSEYATPTQTEANDVANAPLHHATLAVRRIIKAQKAGLSFLYAVYWGIAGVTIYNLWASPDDGMVIAPSGTGREPPWLAYREAWELDDYRLIGYGPWQLEIIAKPAADLTNNTTKASVGFHIAKTWAILADWSVPEASTPASATPACRYEWRRATIGDGKITFTAPVVGQGDQTNRAARPVILPRHGRYNVTCAFTGNTGTVSLIARGYDMLNGLSEQVATSTAGSGTLSVTVKHRPHNHPAVPNDPRLAVVLEATKAAVFSDVVVAPGFMAAAVAPPPPPVVTITAPAAGDTVSGTVTVSATATSAKSTIVGVQFKVGGSNIGAEDTTAPYSVSWNTAAVADGSRTLTAVARDTNGNSTTSAGRTVTVANSAPSSCWLPINDGRANVLVGAFRRPLSEDAEFYPDNHAWHQRWLSFKNTTGIGFNFGAAQYGVDVFDYDAPGSPFTITKDPAGGGDPNNILNDGPMTNFRLPSALVLNPTAGKDSNVNIYRADEQAANGGTWYSFASLRKKTANTATAVSCFKFQSFTAKGWGSPTTGSTAAKFAKAGTMLTWDEMFGPGGTVEHAIHVALGVTRKGGVALLGKGVRWPATSSDSSSNLNDGVIDYGAWGFIKPVSQGGPDIATLGLTECGRRMAKGLQRHGLVVSDMGGVTCKGRCDQTFSPAERSEMSAQFKKLYPYIRFLVTQSDSTTYIGGNTNPVGPYCAHDR